jgi:hypothetical protein
MGPTFITSLNEALQVDGISVLDSDPPGYVRSAGSSVVGIVGDFERGPMGQVVEIGSASEFRRIFGGFGAPPAGSENTWRGYSGFRAVANKPWPNGLRLVRAARTSAVKATRTIDLVTHVASPLVQGRRMTVTAKYHGTYGNRIVVVVSDASDDSLVNGFRLDITLRSNSREPELTASVDNLHAAMTQTQLAAALLAAGVDLVDLAIADSGIASKGLWPFQWFLQNGAEGTDSLAGWTAGVDLLVATGDVNVLFAAEPDGTTVTPASLNGHIKSAVAPATGTTTPLVAVLSGPLGDNAAEAVTAAGSLRSDRLVYAWPWRKAIYADASPVYPGGEVLVPSNDVVACAIANIDVVFDPACSTGTRYVNAATVGLEFDDLSRDDYKTTFRGGVAALEYDPDLGFKIVSGIVTDLSSGKEMIHRRRVADYLNGSLARALKEYQNQPITSAWKEEVRGAVDGFLRTETNAPVSGIPARIIAYEVDTATVNDATTESRGQYNILVRVRTPASARFIVLMSQVGSGVTISEPSTL